MFEEQTGFIKRQFKRDGLIALCARMILGVVFIYTSIGKIVHPEAFAKVIYNYQILPDYFINLSAIVLPWLELILGVFLIIGLFKEGSVFIVNILLIIFLGALSFNLARGLNVHCGCFSVGTEAVNNASTVWYVIRDGLFLVPALYLFYRIFIRKRQEVGISEDRLSSNETKTAD